MAELKKFFDSLLLPPKPPEITEEVKQTYKLHGFDIEKPPTDSELAHWATQLIYQWNYDPSAMMNLPLTALVVSYNMTTWDKLSEMDKVNLKTLLCAVYNMGYNMGVYKLRSPFDKKPQPQDVN